MPPSKKTKRETIEQWRKKHWGELDKSINAAIEIRDSKTTSPQDRVRAIRIVADMLGALKAGRGVQESEAIKKFNLDKPPEIKQSVKDKLKALQDD